MGFFSFKNKTNTSSINWRDLDDESMLEDIKAASSDKPILILKHSTRCSISVMSKSRLENQWDLTDEDIIPYYLDLLRYRSVSDKIAEDFNVPHQSPQILIIKGGECVYTSSHNSIDLREIKKEL